MDTIKIVAPVLGMLFIGMFCKKARIISQIGVDDIKKIITTIIIPVTIFHAVATAEYSIDVVWVFVLMFSILFAGFFAGFALKGIVKEPYRRYFPFLMTVYEGGMISYPLYLSLMGAEHMSNIALVDAPGGIFGFGIYFGLLKMADQGVKSSGKELLNSALTSPPFAGLMLGLFMGLTGLMNLFLGTPAGQIYLPIKEMISAPLSAMILICVGYEFSLEKDSVGVCLKTGICRLLLQAILLTAALFVGNQMGFEKPMLVAIAVYITTIPSLCLSSFVKNEQAGKYMSTTASLYMIINIIAYAVIAAIV